MALVARNRPRVPDRRTCHRPSDLLACYLLELLGLDFVECAGWVVAQCLYHGFAGRKQRGDHLQHVRRVPVYLVRAWLVQDIRRADGVAAWPPVVRARACQPFLHVVYTWTFFYGLLASAWELLGHHVCTPLCELPPGYRTQTQLRGWPVVTLDAIVYRLARTPVEIGPDHVTVWLIEIGPDHVTVWLASQWIGC